MDQLRAHKQFAQQATDKEFADYVKKLAAKLTDDFNWEEVHLLKKEASEEEAKRKMLEEHKARCIEKHKRDAPVRELAAKRRRELKEGTWTPGVFEAGSLFKALVPKKVKRE